MLIGLRKRLRQNPFLWRNVLNREAVRAHSRRRFRLDDKLNPIVKALTRDGVVTTAASEVFSDAAIVDELRDQVATNLEINTHHGDCQSETKADDKPYMTFLLGQNPHYDPTSVYARFAIQQPLLDIADAYFGMLTKVRYYNVWHNQATEKAPTASQLWHRDREDLMILKVFVYLNDVTVENGPFVYAPGTHLVGKSKVEPEFSIQSSVARSTDDQMSRVVPKHRWVQCLGRSGTVVFADTRGFHRGGLVERGERLLFTCMFTSPSCQRNYFQYPSDRQASSATEQRLLP